MFYVQLYDRTLEEIREVTNNAWDLGDERFKEKIEFLLNRRAYDLNRKVAIKSQKPIKKSISIESDPFGFNYMIY